MVLILDQNNEVQTSVLYTLGILPSEDYKEVLEALDSGETPNFPEYQWEYTDLVGYTFKMLTASDYYQEESDGTFSQITADDDVEKLVEEKVKTSSSPESSSRWRRAAIIQCPPQSVTPTCSPTTS